MGQDVEKSVFIVWCPGGPTNPRCTHANAQAAQREAERMALAHPGKEFFVMVSVMSAKKSDLVIRRFDFADDEIPF